MNNDLLRGVRALGKGKIRQVPHGLGHRIECVSGALWITQDGDIRDIVLETGEAFAFDRPGAAWISALDESRFLLLETCVPAAAH